MKTNSTKILIRTVWCICCFAARPDLTAETTLPSQVQTQQPVPTRTVTSSGWIATLRDETSTTMEMTNWVLDSATGIATPEPHRIINVGTGLNFLNQDGVYQPSEDRIELMPDGSAAALKGPMKAYFRPDLASDTDPAVTIVTKSNRVLYTRPV